MAEVLGTAVLSLFVNDKGMTAGMAAARAKATKSMGAMGAGATALANKFALPMLAIGAVSVKMAREFGGSMTKIQTLVGVSKEQVDDWRGALLKMAPALGKSPKELADALFFVTSAGFRGAEAIDILTIAAKASKVGLGETKVVADALTSAINAYGPANLTAARAGDILTATVREGKAEASAIAPVLGNLLPLASELGVGFDEVGGSIAQMTRIGMSASTAGTALQALMSGLLKTTKPAAEKLASVGLSAAGLRDQLKNKGLISVLQTLNEKFGGNVEAMAEVFPNIRALKGVLALAGKAGAATTDVFNGVTDSVGMLGDGFKVVSEKDGEKLTRALVKLQVTSIRLGDAILPVAAKIIDAFGNMVGAFSALPGPVQKGIAVFMGIVLAALLLIKAVTAARLALMSLAMTPMGAFLVATGLVLSVMFGLNSSANSGASAMERYRSSTSAATDALLRLKEAALDVTRANLSHRAAILELKTANAGLITVQGQVNSGELKGRDASLALEDAKIRVARASLDVKTTSLGVTKAVKSEKDEVITYTAATKDQVQSAKDRVTEARSNIIWSGKSKQTVAELTTAEGLLAGALRGSWKEVATSTGKISAADGPAKILAGAVDVLRGKTSGASGAVDKLGKRLDTFATSSAPKAAGAANTVGKDMISGLITGIGSLAGNVEAAFRGVVARAIAAGKDEAQARSNSRVTMKLGRDMSNGLATGVGQRAHAVARALSKAVKDAVREARSNAMSLAGSIASGIGEAINAQLDLDVAALDLSPEAVRLRKIEADQKSEQKIRDEAALRKAVAEAENDGDRKTAQTALDDWLTEQTAQTLRDNLALERKKLEDSARDRTAAFTRGITELTNNLNLGLITQDKFNTDLQALLAASGPEYANLGTLLGGAFATAFGEELKALRLQVARIAKGVGDGVEVGPGGVTDPFAVQFAEWKARHDELRKARGDAIRDAQNAGGSSGRKITKGEQDRIDRTAAALKAWEAKKPKRLARGGMVTGSLGRDRAGLFALSHGEGVMRATAMEGIQRFFEKGGSGGGGGLTIQIAPGGTILGAGDERNLARELARLVAPVINRRVGMPA